MRNTNKAEQYSIKNTKELNNKLKKRNMETLNFEGLRNLKHQDIIQSKLLNRYWSEEVELVVNSLKEDKVKITKQFILDITINGLLVLIMLFPELLDVIKSKRNFKKVKNTIRGERNASLSCFLANDGYRLYDFGDPEFSGNVFSIFCKVFKIDNTPKNFPMLLGLIYEFVTGEKAPERNDNANFFESELKDDVDFEIEELPKKKWDKPIKKYLKKHLIKSKVLSQNNVVIPKSYTFRSQNNGKVYKRIRKENEIILAHKMNNHVKVYCPFGEYKHLWINGAKDSYCFGLESLKEVIEELEYINQAIEAGDYPEELIRGQVIISSGMKDTLVLQSLGYNAICFNSETTTYVSSIIEDTMLKMNQECVDGFEIAIVYDLDSTGEKSAEALAAKFKEYTRFTPRIIKLPKQLKKKGGKDVSDWITLGLSVQKLRDALQPKFETDNETANVVSSVSPISSNPNNLKAKRD